MLVTRAAASSIANGIPSRRRQISTIWSAFVGSSWKPDRVAPRDPEQPHRVARRDRVQARLGRRDIERRHPQQPLARHPQCLRGSSPARAPLVPPAVSPRRSRPPRRADARSCRARSTPACRPGSRTRSRRAIAPAVACTPNAATITWEQVGVVGRGRAHTATHHPRTAAASRPRPAPRAASCPPRRRRSTSPAATRSSAFATPATSSSRPTNDVSCTGRLPGNASSDRRRGKSLCQLRVHDLEHHSGRLRSRSRCSPRSTSEQPRATRPRRGPRSRATPNLSAVTRAHDSRRPIHRRAVIVAVALLPSPVCTPIRTRNGTGLVPRLCANARCASIAASSASRHARERRVKTVTRRLHDTAVMRVDRRAQQLVVTRQRRPASRPDRPPTDASNPRGR